MCKKSELPETLYRKVGEKFDSLFGQDFIITNINKEKPRIRRNSVLPLQYTVQNDDLFYIDLDENDFLQLQSIKGNIPATLAALESNRNSTFLNLGYLHELVIQKKHLVQEALEQFGFSNQKIRVIFVGEVGEDLAGITRSLFAEFWEEFFLKYGTGKYIYNLCFSPDKALTEQEVRAAGRILVTGYIVTGYIPAFINHAFLYRLLSGKVPSSNYIKDSFLNCLDSFDQAVIEQALPGAKYGNKMKSCLVNIFYQFGFSSVPKSSNIHKANKAIENMRFMEL